MLQMFLCNLKSSQHFFFFFFGRKAHNALFLVMEVNVTNLFQGYINDETNGEERTWEFSLRPWFSLNTRWDVKKLSLYSKRRALCIFVTYLTCRMCECLFIWIRWLNVQKNCLKLCLYASCELGTSLLGHE